VVLRGIQQLNIGLGFEGGLAVVILAVILDRLSQSLSTPPATSVRVRVRSLVNLWRLP
jgi:glycine betaine/proline transport system permease protein